MMNLATAAATFACVLAVAALVLGEASANTHNEHLASMASATLGNMDGTVFLGLDDLDHLRQKGVVVDCHAVSVRVSLVGWHVSIVSYTRLPVHLVPVRLAAVADEREAEDGGPLPEGLRKNWHISNLDIFSPRPVGPADSFVTLEYKIDVTVLKGVFVRVCVFVETLLRH